MSLHIIPPSRPSIVTFSKQVAFEIASQRRCMFTEVLLLFGFLSFLDPEILRGKPARSLPLSSLALGNSRKVINHSSFQTGLGSLAPVAQGSIFRKKFQNSFCVSSYVHAPFAGNSIYQKWHLSQELRSHF